MMYTDDPIADFLEYDRIQELQAECLPHCVRCGEAIMDDYIYDFGDGNMCEDCAEEYIDEHRRDNF